MDLRDVSYFAIVDSTKRILYELIYDDAVKTGIFDDLDIEAHAFGERTLFSKCKQTSGPISIYFVLLANKEANELFISSAFDSFLENADRIMKNGWTLERFETKYDMFVLLSNEFLFNGIILEDDKDKLYGRQQKRSFESIGGIKVNKGLASMLNKAAKSVKNSFSLNK